MQHVDIMEGPDGRSKGCAVVWFDSPDAARRAIGNVLLFYGVIALLLHTLCKDMFNDYEVDGRKLEVRYDRMN